MKFLYSDEPIIACSTSLTSNAALAVIRISGFDNFSRFVPFFAFDLSGPIEPRRVYYTKLVLQGQLIDDVCLTYFAAPKSFNGENILELSVHGNVLNVERIIDIFIKHGGCRLAQPGEFSYRALKNQKLSLSQVEGLDLFLNANSGYALDQGLSLLCGSLNRTYQELYDLYLAHKSSLELSIDFSDDVGESTAKNYLLTTFRNFYDKFTSLHKRVEVQSLNLFQPEITIAGLPNSGKSSLFNYLLSDNRAIVSATPGTTRDFLTEMIFIEGVKYRLIDTAGIRDSRDMIESEGIHRSRKLLEQSFFSILLINPFEILEGFEEILNHPFDLILYTHSDLAGFKQARAMLDQQFPLLGSIGAINLTEPNSTFEEEFKAAVNKKYLKEIGAKPILLSRHKHLISLAFYAIQDYHQLLSSEADVGILSHELNSLGHCLSELLGIISPDQVLNSIFSNFCIGK